LDPAVKRLFDGGWSRWNENMLSLIDDNDGQGSKDRIKKVLECIAPNSREQDNFHNLLRSLGYNVVSEEKQRASASKTTRIVHQLSARRAPIDGVDDFNRSFIATAAEFKNTVLKTKNFKVLSQIPREHQCAG
jgi:translation initiation factor 2B subunit (eIF-2B alpha/beta/delta family)